jgi:DNA (cytosine-5)-methyltransferase 1
MRYLSVCSGIEAATVAWHELGWTPAAFSEIEPFPSAVLAHHYPEVPNLGDMTKYKEWNLGADGIDLLVGGTPCQSFSVAGLRRGMDDPRGNLALVYCGLLDHLRPRWFVWENVPGVLSSNGGRDFGSFLGALAQLGYGFAYRVLDARFFGVAQRRRRVFVVGHLADWRPAAAVLFERESLRRDTAPSREARDVTARSIAHSVDECGIQRTVGSLCTDTHPGAYSGQDAYTGRLIPQRMAVRRLTPTECERLQGFPDGYTNIKENCPDGPRYKALGNSMAVPVMRWIGQRIQMLEGL